VIFVMALMAESIAPSSRGLTGSPGKADSWTPVRNG
jgi:hypothetical protein